MLSRDHSTGENLAYVFLILAGADADYQAEYREARAAMLQTYCLATLHDNRDIAFCVGIAITALSDKGDSEDIVAFPQQEWNAAVLEILKNARETFEIIQKAPVMSSHPYPASEFPPDPAFEVMSRQQRRALQRQQAKAARALQRL